MNKIVANLRFDVLVDFNLISVIYSIVQNAIEFIILIELLDISWSIWWDKIRYNAGVVTIQFAMFVTIKSIIIIGYLMF